MSRNERPDPGDSTSTYVLEETAVTRVMSIEELAEMALHGQTPDAAPASHEDVRPTIKRLGR